MAAAKAKARLDAPAPVSYTHLDVYKRQVVGNSTELKGSVLFDKVQVPHYNYVGDSILGYKAHMGAGSKMCIRDRAKNVHFALFISRLIAPIAAKHGAHRRLDVYKRQRNACTLYNIPQGCSAKAFVKKFFPAGIQNILLGGRW